LQVITEKDSLIPLSSYPYHILACINCRDCSAPVDLIQHTDRINQVGSEIGTGLDIPRLKCLLCLHPDVVRLASQCK